MRLPHVRDRARTFLAASARELPAVLARADMTLSILNVTFDCADSAWVASFWGQATGWPASFDDMPGNPFWIVSETPETSPRLVFVQVPEQRTAKNRIHLDLMPSQGTQAEEMIRLESLGARVVDDRRGAEPGGWVVMADPEGNEFCVEHGLAE